LEEFMKKLLEIPWASCGEISNHNENEALEQLMINHREFLGRDLICIEIGTLYGATAAALAQGGIVYAVDLWGDIQDGEASYDTIGQGTWDRFAKNMVRLKLFNTRVFPIVGSSLALENMTIDADFIYIDACHYLEPVRADIRMAIRHLNATGVIAFHDYTPQPACGVITAVNELVATGEFVVGGLHSTLIHLKRSE
jgi:SAM-dependent methyltransferase